MSVKAMTNKEYVDFWTLNAKQHFEDGDYEWICDEIDHYHSILEIGCGAGYSTLTLVLRDHHVLSVDINQDAIEASQNLIICNDYEAEIATDYIDFGKKEVWFWKADVVSERDAIISVLDQLSIDLVLLINPGGNLDRCIRKNEVDLLLKYGFTQEEIDQNILENAIPLLHKYSMIDAAADIALNIGKPLLIVERGNKEELSKTLAQISEDAGMTITYEDYRRIRKPPEGGIALGAIDGESIEELYWGIGRFEKFWGEESKG